MPWSKTGKLKFAASLLLAGFAIAQSPSAPSSSSPRPGSPGQAVAIQAPPNPASPGQTPPNQQPANPAPAQPRPLLIMLDPAHGGSDPGAALNPAFPEKDVTLVVARRLRQELISRGLPVQLVRDNDATLPIDQRAAMVNAQRPALYIAIHATSQGSGIRVFTAMLPMSEDNRGAFLAWQTAQASSLPRSRAIENQIAGAMQKSSFPVRSVMAPLRPLNNVTVPAIAIELAPASNDVSQLASSDYQQTVCTVLAEAVSSAAPMLRAQAGGAP